VPIAIAIGAIVVAGIGIWLFSGTAQAAEKVPIVVVIKKRETPTIPDIVPPVPPDDSPIRPFPTPGYFYEIKQGDTGSAIALKAYDADRPYAKWLAVAAHPSNRQRLATDYPNWFLPRWTTVPGPQYSIRAPIFTGKYAVVKLPLEGEL
jgi:hypothetical protein